MDDISRLVYNRSMQKRLAVLSLFLFALTLVVPPAVEAVISYGSGYYTNLCGSGTAASSHSCSQACDINSGQCQTSGSRVVRYECDGRQTECRSNESSFASSQSVGSPACGKTVQIDVFDQKCRLDNGGWNDSCVLQDYIVWYSGDCESPAQPQQPETPSGPSCNDYQSLDTQFRKVLHVNWVSGQNISSQLEVGDRIDIQCFAKNGSTTLPDATTYVTTPNGQEVKIRDSGKVRFYKLSEPGNYQFRCESRSLTNCVSVDSLTVAAAPPAETPSPSPTPTVKPTPSPSPSPTPTATPHVAECRDLDVAGGNNQRVPAEVTLRANAEDNRGNIQKYRYFFGDGERLETDEKEVTHTYETSGSFLAKVEFKDSQGNWLSSDRCEARVSVRESAVESHKADCSDVFITNRTNGGDAPSTFTFKVTGYDNKHDIDEYRLEFGDGVSDTNEGQIFEHRYEKAGTYHVKGYIRDNDGDWIGGEDGCSINAFVETEPLVKQPNTGTPTAMSLIGLFSGGTGLALAYVRRRVLA